MTLNELRALLADLTADTEFAGHCYFAGGCVRDLLLERRITRLDADIAVELPQGGLRLARYLQRRLQAPPPVLHRGFGTAALQLPEAHLDCVMTRAETYTPGSRHPRVRFATLAEDCSRRDFTLNALYQELGSGHILDPCGQGLADLEARLLRSLKEPDISFREDPLRLLRALRFAAVLGLDIEADTFAALAANSVLILTLSRQRCRDELHRLQISATPQQLARWRELASITGSAGHLRVRVPELSTLD